MLVGVTAISWVVLFAMVVAWPLVGVLVWFIVRSWRRHDAEHGSSMHGDHAYYALHGRPSGDEHQSHH